MTLHARPVNIYDSYANSSTKISIPTINTIHKYIYIYIHVNQNTNIKTNPNTNSNIDINVNTNTLTGINAQSNTSGKMGKK